MSWFRAFTAAAALLLLSACGFTPLLAQPGTAPRPAVEIASIPDRDGQYLRNLLIDRLNAAGRPADAPYALTLSPLREDVVNLGIRKDASATRAQLQISTRLRLTEKSSGRVLLQRDLRVTGAHNLLDNQFATLVSRQYLTDNMLRELGDSVVTALDLYFRRAGEAL